MTKTLIMLLFIFFQIYHGAISTFRGFTVSEKKVFKTALKNRLLTGKTRMSPEL